MSIKIPCPECGHQIETWNVLDAINAAVGTGSFGRPEEEIDGWRLFFRGYTASLTYTALIGAAMAYRPDSFRVLGVVAGTSKVQTLVSGASFDVGYDIFHTHTSMELAIEKGIEPFIMAKQEAMDLLRSHIRSLAE